jgi:2-amino-4-hydroxy-6-hydroxymethyldihydropteridine diphosphokinase
MRTTYLIALGSNQPHARFGAPRQIIEAALDQLDLPVLARSRVMASRPVGPSKRAYANAAALIETAMMPPELLDHLKVLEAHFGRVGGGQRWRSRVLDLDIVLWSGGMWEEPALQIPHPQFRNRDFVLKPLVEIAPGWRDPVTGYSTAHLRARLKRNETRLG